MEETNRVTIVVDGVTGVGKSSLVKILSEEFDLKPFSEMFEDENMLLHKFFHDRAKWAFPMQTNFLTNRFRQYRQAMKVGRAVMDRSIYSDRIFARMYLEYGYLNPEEYAVYNNLLNVLLDYVTPPQLMVYLRVNTDEAVRRIRKRGRPDELEVEYEYWDTLNKFYEAHYQNFDSTNLLILQVDELDYVNRPEDREYVLNRIRQALNMKGVQKVG
ncbi:Deoxyadenosine/deoxycytidine kinase [Thermosyntropha lipolytica DSM 11003]|uniref:Deoxyadenosine/deoxycytidine kinase n=1 Tax=Thermosyntropha lipolytica DSM 11003 TaxID=1123382 RepID=A0A1M5KFX5_9FIRM|nr:deoxynucleoside kinase [Thermosyntropha lipolytica]SHG51756.1 Deoxyadenosine/deoxycytidine kinase [Thermosyntropha lipolytica DSM 11003]